MSISGVSSPMASAGQKYSFTSKVQSLADIYKAQKAEENSTFGYESSAKSMNLARGNYGTDPVPSIKENAKLLDIGQKIDMMV